MRAVITVVGKDTVGILAKVSTECAKFNVNILDVSQSIMQDMFCMIMLVETADESANFAVFVRFAFSFRKVKFLLNLINRCSGC